MKKVKISIEQEISLRAGARHFREVYTLLHKDDEGVEAQKSDKVTKYLSLKLGDLKYETRTTRMR